MENLHLARKKDTLEIHFDADTGVLALEGASYPENPIEFFDPIYAWIQQYIDEAHGPLTVTIRINYLNTSSSKCILDFLEMLESYHKAGGVVQVDWYYEEDDEDMLETGEELCEDLELSYTMIPY